MPNGRTPVWEFRVLRGDRIIRGELVAYWEVALDPISDDYTPAEISADDLLRRWIDRVRPRYENGLIPIHWFVESPGQGVFEQMPFQYPHLAAGEDFLTHYSWPVVPGTNERLNWLTLPVVDKLWNRQRANKGGFIQEATGWKPAILQPYVYLDSLIRARG